ncbi:MAG TPA: hypothetical protein ENF42_00595 [Candidatus Bathyarchaeota archaeon]|nr:hypothetical protein [Candidatus Bathyarchaeota archaeon]
MRMSAYLRLIRAEHGIAAGIAAVSSILIAGSSEILDLVAGFTVGFLITSGGFAINDYFDVEVDRINRRLDRPLVTGEIGLRQALSLGLLLNVLGVVASAFLSAYAFMVASLFSIGVSISYGPWLKGRHWSIKNMVVGLSYFIPCFYGGFVVMPGVERWLSLLILSLTAFLFGLGREIMKDVMDLEGDRLRNVKSFASIYGVSTALKTASTLYILAVLLSFVAYARVFRSLLFAVTIAPVDIAAVYISAKLCQGVDTEDIRRFREWTILIFLFGLFSFLISSIEVSF